MREREEEGRGGIEGGREGGGKGREFRRDAGIACVCVCVCVCACVKINWPADEQK